MSLCSECAPLEIIAPKHLNVDEDGWPGQSCLFSAKNTQDPRAAYLVSFGCILNLSMHLGYIKFFTFRPLPYFVTV
jgi:hypothetical protein